MSECKTYQSEIEDSARGMSDRARAHAESCGACGEALRASDSLSRLVRGLEKVEAPADFEFRLRARMASRKGGRGRFQTTRRGALSGYLTVAAAVCFLVISASLYLWQWHAPASERKDSVAVESEKASQPTPASVASVPSGTSNPVAVGDSVPSAIMKQASGIRPRAGSQRQVRETARIEDGKRTVANNSFAVSSAPIMISVNRPAEPLRVVLRDEQGAAHVVRMRAVSFGSQEILSRDVAGARSDAKSEEGVW
ncbi:MAG TPA: hypothetical protein VLJ61_15370 [Pyrinomonadaceae bacterium]|nr:hypothetical protein [Pyrinomonadaceae bacterium]